jgi:hypothetical protein
MRWPFTEHRLRDASIKLAALAGFGRTTQRWKCKSGRQVFLCGVCHRHSASINQPPSIPPQRGESSGDGKTVLLASECAIVLNRPLVHFEMTVARNFGAPPRRHLPKIASDELGSEKKGQVPWRSSFPRNDPRRMQVFSQLPA